MQSSSEAKLTVPLRRGAHDNGACPFIPFELTQWPITFLSLVSRTTMTIKGGANRLFRIADQNGILTALIPE